MPFSTARPSARLRTALFTSAAIAGLVVAGSAHAQAASGTEAPTNAYLEAQGGNAASLGGTPQGPTNIYLAPQGNTVALDPVAPTPEIVVANPGTTVTSRDPNNITGIGQMIVDEGNGFIGLCTATLINPRTVIFAAHCVNSAAANSYGANSGGIPIGFGFEANTRSSGAGKPDELVQWLFGGVNGAGQHQTNVGSSFYNSNYVAYNQYSLEPAANGFLYGDVAMASLDTPAAGIPTWALLFSPLPATTVTAEGTGYNVGIVGYGAIGTGQTGETANSDYRRRAAENILGGLTDLQTFEAFNFGGAPNGLTQNLYMLDFDDPRRGVSGASPFDFNTFRDNARVTNGTPTEGITAPGDSGGPLILQNFAQQVVIGTLSGGYARFFNGQPQYGYGAVSFYQPLYLYWDWIAANNPYHYVASVAGNGSWTDPNHWVSTLDPAYMILSGGQLVNGLPTVAGEQKNGTSGDFGQLCEQGPSALSGASFSDCYDTSTGVETYDPSGHPIGTATSQPDTAAVGGKVNGMINVIAPQDGSDSSLGQSTAALPPATLANGRPGATGFVPNNADPDRTAGVAPKYFDVTLVNDGTTTISGANITIDRLTIGGAGAALVIDPNASLTTLIDTTQFAGMVTVNGTLTSVGDYSLMGGALLGSGRINAPFLTSVLGQFAPGTQNTIGTMTIGGNLVMSSGTTYFVNIGNSGTSDKIAVVANGASSGTANIGGAVLFSPVAGYTIRYADTFTILTAAGGVTGTFATPAAFSPILHPTFTYTANAVQVNIAANSYASVVANTPVQNAYAQLLDQNRVGNYQGLRDVYGVLDLSSQAAIQSTLESWAPRSEQLGYQLDRVAVDNMSRFYNERTGMLGNGQNGGTVAMIGQPLSMLAAATTPGMVGADAGAMGQSDTTTAVAPAKLPSNMSAYIAGGYLRGDATPMPTAIPIGGRNDFDGYYFAGGLEADLGGGSGIGVSGAYTHLDGTTVSGGAKTGLVQFTVYGKKALGGKAVIDGQFGIGSLDAKTVRTASLGGTNYTLRSSSQPFVINGEIGISAGYDLGSVRLAPRAAIRGASIGLDDTQEYGGPMALRIHRRSLRSLESRLGATLDGGQKIHPYLSGYYVHDFEDGRASFGANFAGGIGPNALFALSSKDKDWFEVSGGLAIDAGPVTLSVGADSTIDRNDVDNQSYRGSIKFRF